MKGDANMRIMTDEEYCTAVAVEGNLDDLSRDIIDMRREGIVQIFDDGSGEPFIALMEHTN